MIVMPRRPPDGKAVDDVAVTVGQRIAQIRNRRGLTQIELAKKIQSSQALLSAYELGRARVGADVLIKIASALNVSADEILGLKDVVDADIFPNRRILRRILRFKDLPRRRQDSLLDTIDGVLEGVQKIQKSA